MVKIQSNTIGVVMMVKNESKRILISLLSIKDVADALIIYDTGSTDNTLDIIRTFAKTNDIKLHIKEGLFVNFAESRNVMMEFASTVDVDYLLKLDCNDELREPKKFLHFVNNIPSNHTGFLVCQIWFHGGTDEYYNIRLVKNNNNWRYFGAVHEYIQDTSINPPQQYKCPKDWYIYQDRTKDDDKTGKRFIKDKDILKNEMIKNPNDTRSMFYLAQTYACLSDYKESYECYKIRYEMKELGYTEERFISCIRCGEYAIDKINLGWDVGRMWFMRGLELIDRIEPYLFMTKYYISVSNWRMAYTFAKLAVDLPPTDCNLFIDKNGYEYTRYHLMGWCSYYHGKIDEGMKACEIAVKARNLDIDKNNLIAYKKLKQSMKQSMK
jgi:glycosyltransferase involved in cell wall biosynthesis